MSGECPTCGPTTAEQHPRQPAVTRCGNCKEWLTRAPTPVPSEVAETTAGEREDNLREVIQQAAKRYLSDFDTVMNVRSEARDLAIAIERAIHASPLLDRVRREEGAKVLREAADEMEAVIADGDFAEVAAPVSGEVGRSTVVARRDALYEEPHEWLRARAASVGPTD